MRFKCCSIATLISALVTPASIGVLYAQTAAGTGAAVPLLPHLAGYNNQTAAISEPWRSETRREALVRARPALLRYPGGTVSTYWDMRQDRLFRLGEGIDLEAGTVLQKRYVINWVAAMQGQPNPLADLKAALDAAAEATSSAPPAVLFVLNMATPGADYYSSLWRRPVDQTPGSADWWAMLDDRLQRNFDMLDRAVKLGIPVRYVEFGNEYYFGTGAVSAAGATVEPYVAGVLPVDRNMIGAFPDSDSPLDPDSEPDLGKAYACAVNDWARQLLARYPGVRLCAVASDGTGGARRRGWNANVARFVDRALVPAVSFHMYGGISSGNLTDGEDGLAEAMESWMESWEAVRRSAAELASREFWITEWNSNRDVGTWGHGLHCLFALSTWLADGNLGLTAYHQFSANSTLVGAGPEITATARAISLFALASAGMSQAQPVLWDQPPLLAGKSRVPALVGWKFSRADSTCPRYLLVHYGAEPRTVDVSALLDGATAKVVQAHAPLGRQTTDPGERTLATSGQLELPAYSVTVFWTGPDSAESCLEGCRGRQADAATRQLKAMPPGKKR